MEDILKTNKDYINDFLNTIENEFNVHCIKRRYSDGYFILDYGEDSICNFKIKELPDFTFGIWMSNNVDLDYYDSSYKNSKLIFFTQPTINIDKFKPSRSSFCLPIERYIESDGNNNQEYRWWLTEVQLMLDALKKNKIKSFYKADWSSWDFYDDVSYIKALRYYISSYYLYYKRKFIEKHKMNKIIKLVRKKFNNLKDVRAVLYYSKGWSPSLDLAYCIKSNISEEENNLLTKIDDWFDKNYFMDISLREYNESDYFKLLHSFNEERIDRKKIWMKT